jgi:hypothetical protein
LIGRVGGIGKALEDLSTLYSVTYGCELINRGRSPAMIGGRRLGSRVASGPAGVLSPLLLSAALENIVEVNGFEFDSPSKEAGAL